ncbi:MAG TPA: hypothetical protein VGP24_00790, partial [Glaciihabitans sp.]|nr:hypothetical protein [Glaciihabitans sp.]
MSNSYPSVPQTEQAPPTAPITGSGGRDESAKEKAGHVADEAKGAAKKVTGTAKDEAGRVASEAKTQAKDLFNQTSSEIREQAGVQQKRVASGLHSLSDELNSMADRSEGSGVASDLVQQVAGRAGSVASWLDDRDPGTLLEDVKDFARRRPGAFIGIAAVAGVLAGRLTRSLVSSEKDATETSATTSTPTAPRATTGIPTGTPAVTD